MISVTRTGEVGGGGGGGDYEIILMVARGLPFCEDNG